MRAISGAWHGAFSRCRRNVWRHRGDARMDDSRTDDSGGRWMTYSQLAAARGIKRSAAQRLVQRHKWPRREGSNDGFARVLVPPDMTKPAPLSPHRADGHPDVIPRCRRHRGHDRGPCASNRLTSGRHGSATATSTSATGRHGRLNGHVWPRHARRSRCWSSSWSSSSVLLRPIAP